MRQNILNTFIFIIMSTMLHAENMHNSADSNATERQHNPVKIKTVRNVQGGYDLSEHTKGQIRAGYITVSQEGESRTNGYALSGHTHFDTGRWNGIKLDAEVYTVLNLGINQNPLNTNPDFFDENGKSFILLSQLHLHGKWENTEIKLGRQSLDTPHADSDDIRMMPNYFEAYTIKNTGIDDVTLTAGFIRRMAGWENGINARQFVNVGETLGTEKINGVSYASASYDGVKDLSLSLWYYNYKDIADVIYAEAGYTYHFTEETTLTLGLQYDGSQESGAALLGQQDAKTYGLSMELASEETGIHILAAYNRDDGETGAMALSLGGGPFFTSMEDQTLDAIEAPGRAWLLGAGFHFSAVGIEGLNAGIAYGNFKAEDASLYESHEVDAVIEYSFNDKFSLTAAFASVDFETTGQEDYDQFRLIANYSF